MQLESLIALVAKALDEDPSKINENTTASQIDNWDSLGHIQILQALDEQYNEVSAKIPELGSVTSIKELHNLLANV